MPPGESTGLLPEFMPQLTAHGSAGRAESSTVDWVAEPSNNLSKMAVHSAAPVAQSVSMQPVPYQVRSAPPAVFVHGHAMPSSKLVAQTLQPQGRSNVMQQARLLPGICQDAPPPPLHAAALDSSFAVPLPAALSSRRDKNESECSTPLKRVGEDRHRTESTRSSSTGRSPQCWTSSGSSSPDNPAPIFSAGSWLAPAASETSPAHLRASSGRQRSGVEVRDLGVGADFRFSAGSMRLPNPPSLLGEPDAATECPSSRAHKQIICGSDPATSLR